MEFVAKKSVKKQSNTRYQSTKNTTGGKKEVSRVDKNRKNYNERKDVNLDLTNEFDITIDDTRLMNLDTLDTSFLDEKRKKRVKIISEVSDKESKKKSSKKVVKFRKKKPIFYFILLLILGIIIGVGCSLLFNKFFVKPEVKIVTKKITKEVTIVDDNYLFLGDSITDYYDLDKYYEDLFVVNSGISGDTTQDILDDMENRVYKYNPSKVFLLIGTNDLLDDISNEDTVKNIGKIIDEIQKNRPYAEIYLESIYPVNAGDDDKINHRMVGKRDNENIRKMNEELKELAKEKKVTYIDMYSLLQDDEENLKLEYTNEGLHISDEGYEKITDELMKYIKK